VRDCARALAKHSIVSRRSDRCGGGASAITHDHDLGSACQRKRFLHFRPRASRHSKRTLLSPDRRTSRL
jgi:hypothetical protein